MRQSTAIALAICAFFAETVAAREAALRAGAAAVDVTPEAFPVVVNCGFVEASGRAARDRLFARTLILDDSTTRLAITVVDSCMLPREFLDRAKEMVAAETGIPTNRQLISATHTHSAPAVMGCLGSDPDPIYGPFLERQIVRAARLAVANLTPAKAGWGVVPTSGLTNNRQWILRSDRIRNDPFGRPTVRSNMHPGHANPDFVGPSGPVDPWLSVLAVRALDDRPIAVLANFSMHYFGSAPVSADYFGRVCLNLERRIVAETKSPRFVAILSQGTAGDLHWMDYGALQIDPGIDKYAEAVTERAIEAFAKVQYRSELPIGMAESALTLDRRVPDAERLAWARSAVAALNGRKPTTQPDIYAREAVLLHDEPTRELKLQAIRIGDLGIAAIPNEVFALTGLNLKAMSPFATTFTIELANGSEGYIPPAEQHVLGGYTTWPARTAGLNVGAEAAIREAALGLLEKVAARKRNSLPDPIGDPYAKAVLATKPIGYWRLGESFGTRAGDLARGNAGSYEPGVVLALEGPLPRQFEGLALTNRAAHFAGGRMSVRLPNLGDHHTVELWLWNGFPANARDWTGTPFSLAAKGVVCDSLVLGGTKGTPNVLAALVATHGAEPPVGSTPVAYRSWSHVAFVRDGERVRAYLNGKLDLEATVPRTGTPDTLHVGGRADCAYAFEGRIAEVAVYDRSLRADEIAARLGVNGR